MQNDDILNLKMLLTSDIYYHRITHYYYYYKYPSIPLLHVDVGVMYG